MNTLLLALIVGFAAPTVRLFENDGGQWYLMPGLGGTGMLAKESEATGDGGFGLEFGIARYYNEDTVWLALLGDVRFGDDDVVGGLGLRIGALLFAIDGGPIVSGDGFGWRLRGALDIGWLSIFRGAEVIAGRTDQTWGVMLRLPWSYEDGKWWLLGKPGPPPPGAQRRR